jgi:DnaJ-class molecular chaperone
MDPYEILGVSKTASDDDIKRAYRNLAKKYHPDLNPNNKEAEQKFKKISVAYSLIETKEAREKFEKGQFDEQAADARFRSGPFYRESQENGGRYTNYYEGDNEDILNAFFSKFTGKNGQTDLPGQDHLYKMDIDLKDAVLGAEREILLEGTKLKVKIPAGIAEGTKLKFKEQGGHGIGKGKRGDAYVEISFKSSDNFKKNGSDVEIEIPINIDEAVNGSKIEAPAIDGLVFITIPPGSNTGTKLRLKGKGLPHQHGNGRGDQIIILKVMLPPKTDSDFNAFIKRWSADHSYNPREKSVS